MTTAQITEVSSAHSDNASKPTSLQKFTRRRVINWLSQLDGGAIRFRDGADSQVFGVRQTDERLVDWTIHDPGFYSSLATGGALGLAESYLRGAWHADDLTQLLRVMYRNHQSGSKVSTVLASMSRNLLRLVNHMRGNTIDGSRRHIAAHYDLSNEFFALFLDASLMYSSAYFEDDEMSLYDASIAKLDMICGKLDLHPGDDVLEIGTGWGGFALHAVKNYDIDLTTTTISAAQVEKAKQRFDQEGIGDRVRLLDRDYRNLDGQYSKLVSIEMIEAVGERYLDDYFRQCGRLLKPGGRFVLQGIVMPEQRYESYRRSVDFIQKYIFPGGFLPSVTAMQQSIGRTTNLRLQEIDDLSSHYARTLQHWRHRFIERLDDVRRLGFDDRFIRMWEYYLCYCEAAFREQAVRVVQIVWDQPNH